MENPVVISIVRQTGVFGRQPLKRRKTPSPTSTSDYRVFSDSAGRAVGAEKQQGRFRPNRDVQTGDPGSDNGHSLSAIFPFLRLRKAISGKSNREQILGNGVPWTALAVIATATVSLSESLAGIDAVRNETRQARC